MQGTGKISKVKTTFAGLLVCFYNVLGIMGKLLVTENISLLSGSLCCNRAGQPRIRLYESYS